MQSETHGGDRLVPRARIEIFPLCQMRSQAQSLRLHGFILLLTQIYHSVIRKHWASGRGIREVDITGCHDYNATPLATPPSEHRSSSLYPTRPMALQIVLPICGQFLPMGQVALISRCPSWRQETRFGTAWL